MDITAITTLISTVGFPITCVVYMAYDRAKREERQDVKDEKMNETLSTFSLNIQANTQVLNQILDYVKEDNK
jgi:hypothetical protein